MRAQGHSVRSGCGVALVLFLAGCAGAPPPERVSPLPVLPGIEVLLRDSLHLVRDLRVGLVSNAAGVDAAGTSDVERLMGASVGLSAIFSPEHGFRGTAAPGEAVASSTDSATGLPIYSLYGVRRAPSDSILRNLDAILVDLPDVGARYYTYLSTTIEVMRAAARSGRTVIILDRPNPIGGAVQGNLLDSAYRSFVGPLAMPMRHGLTLGELARLANRELGLGADLRVVPAQGWTRAMTLGETGLPFIPPSPNLKDPESLFHYPGVCLFEGTALSVGRGTDAPFRQIGAPWLMASRVAELAGNAGLPGVRFEPVRFTPSDPGDGKYPGLEIAGIRLVMTDQRSYDPAAAAVTLLAAVYQVHPDSIGFRAAGFDRLAGGPALREAIVSGRSGLEISRDWVEARERWKRYRESVLLYR